MKYSVLGFNQSKIVETDLDLTDLLILNYILQACGSPKMKHILDGTDYPLVWIQHKKLSEDLPILRISEGTLRNRLTKLRQGGYIMAKTVASENLRGTRTYYGLTELTTSFIYDVEDTTTSQNNDVEDRARHFKMTSDNLLTNNKELNNTISKDIVGETPTDTSLSEYEQHMFTEDVRKKRNIVQKDSTEKKTKKSRWEKCSEMIDEYTQDEELRKALRDYLSDRLAMKDKPIYANQWKGLLNRLTELSATEDPIKIVKQSIERAYGGFFPVREYGNYNRKPNPSVFGEHERMSSKKVTKEEREEIMRNGKVF